MMVARESSVTVGYGEQRLGAMLGASLYNTRQLRLACSPRPNALAVFWVPIGAYGAARGSTGQLRGSGAAKSCPTDGPGAGALGDGKGAEALVG